MSIMCLKSCLVLPFLFLCFELLAKNSVNDSDKREISNDIHDTSLSFKNSQLVMELSEKARYEENIWVGSDKKLLYLEKRRLIAEQSVFNSSSGIIKNIRNLDKDNKVLSIVLNNKKEEINQKCHDLAYKNEYINKIIREENKAKNDKINAIVCLNNLKLKFENFYENIPKQRPKRLYSDAVKLIVSKADSLEKLYSLIRSEVSAGNLRSLPKCKVINKYVSYPGEFSLSLDFKFDKKNFISKEIQIRKSGFVFAPITGTVVFVSNYDNNGVVIGINNSEKGLVLVTDLDKSFIHLGEIVLIGQVIGIAKSTILDDDYSFIKIIASTK